MKTVEEIIVEIQSGVTDLSYGEQVRYIQGKIKEYADHPEFELIEKTCNRLIGELMPEDKKEAIYEQLTLELNSVYEKLNRVRDLIHDGKYTEAIDITMPLSEMADRRPIIEDDGESACFNFTEDFERVIYLEIEKQNGRNTADHLKEISFPYFDIYALNGTCLLEFGRYREASEEFKKASYWNPASAYVRFQYVVTFFMMNAAMKTWSLSIDNMKYLFRRYDIAQCYFHLSHCYEAGDDEEAAVACLLLSNSYYRNEDREKYMKAKMKETGFLPSYFTEEKMKEIAEKYRFPLNPEKTAIKLAYENGISEIDEDPELAVYYLKIARGLSDAPEIEEKLAMAEKKLETVKRDGPMSRFRSK